MFRHSALLFGHFFSLSLFAQNLVPNHSFEDHSDCPDDYGQVDLCTGWSRSTNNNDPEFHTEFLHACGSPTFSAPTSTWGFQEPVEGDGYMALVTLAPAVMANYRENIYAELNRPLQIGKPYLVQLNISLTDNSKYASNNFGVKLATTPDFPINNVCQLAWPNVVTDTEEWTTISTIFIADSAYTHIALGNFKTDANTTSITVCPSCPFTLHGYYLDKVCLMDLNEEGSYNCSVSSNEVSVIEHGALQAQLVPTFLDGSDRSLTLVRGPAFPGVATIFDAQGRAVLQVPIGSSTVERIELRDIAAGTYILNFTDRSENVFNARFVVAQ